MTHPKICSPLQEPCPSESAGPPSYQCEVDGFSVNADVGLVNEAVNDGQNPFLADGLVLLVHGLQKELIPHEPRHRFRDVAEFGRRSESPSLEEVVERHTAVPVTEDGGVLGILL